MICIYFLKIVKCLVWHGLKHKLMENVLWPMENKPNRVKMFSDFEEQKSYLNKKSRKDEDMKLNNKISRENP